MTEEAWLTGAAPQLAGSTRSIATVRALLASQSTSAAENAAIERCKESVMFAIAQVGRTTQHIVCGFLAAVIVAASLSVGAFGAQSALHEGYSVTITQIE
jgi:hypothetical protein